MADMTRRIGGVHSQQSYMQVQAAAAQQQLSACQQQMQAPAQLNPYQYQQQQSKVPTVHPSRSSPYRSSPYRSVVPAARPPAQKPSTTGARMGIKSGMTVEDLKRLTQKRMQQSGASNPATPKTPAPESFSPSTLRLNLAEVNDTFTPAAVATPPVVPKTGMSVQELKQLTALRVASQHVPVHTREVPGLESHAVLTNATKAQYRDTLRTSLTPENTPKRSFHTRSSSSTQVGSLQYSNDLSRSHGPLSSGVSGDWNAERGPRSRSRSSQFPNIDVAVTDVPLHYSYASTHVPENYVASYDVTASGGNAKVSQEAGSLDDCTRVQRHAQLQFSEEAFPPPPPMDESGGFVSTALPSWSPPPARSKKVNPSTSSGATFYNQQTSYYNIASKDESATASDYGASSSSTDQNAVLAPPPGLTRRPSMTVPWQVAEAVLNTPQTTNTGRKKLVDVDGETSLRELTTSAAEAAAQLTGLSLQSSAHSQSNTNGLQPPPLAGALASSPCPLASMQLSGGTVVARRGSFGNAAEFFKFRRRSKSRLELARDLAFVDSGEMGGYLSYGTARAMPGIAERHGEVDDDLHEGSGSDKSSSSSINDESSSQEYTDEDVVQVTGGYDDTEEIPGSFVSFYNASRQHQGGLSSLFIPPPPPPPPQEDDEASPLSSAQGHGLPMMSPNGARLRKVAELARQGSLSNEDKTRVKDEIIQHSLGIGASTTARLLAGTKEEPGDRVPTTATAPPEYLGMPRVTPKASTKKLVAPGSGIVKAPSSTSASAAATALGGRLGSFGSPTASLEQRLATAAQRVAECVGKGDMAGFQEAIDDLDWLRNEASKLMHG